MVPWSCPVREHLLRGACLLVLTTMPAALEASPVPNPPGFFLDENVLPYPGDAFDWPAAGVDGYSWIVDLTGVTTLPTTVVDFTVTNIAAVPLLVSTFQIFGNCDGMTDAAHADFDLSLNGTPTPWSAVEDGPCLYHNYLDFILPVGATRFTVDLANDRNTAPLLHADVRLGNVIAAVPLPPPAVLLLGGLTALALVRRRRAA